MNLRSLRLWLFALAAAPALAGDTPAAPPPDKAPYHLFNPVPRALLRELSTDRPDQTESPCTVDAGHFQVEMDFLNFTYDRRGTGGAHSEVWNIAPINLKAGLLPNVDLQILLDSYIAVRGPERASGFGDITARLKVNLWGNDGGPTALAIMPFVKLPLDASNLRNGKTEGGVIIPLAVGLPGGWSLGLMTEVDFVSDGGGGYATEWVNSITFSHDLTKRLGGYVEFFSATGSAWVAQADVGFTYAVTGDVQFDFGCNFGVTAAAPDCQPFAGLSWRF